MKNLLCLIFLGAIWSPNFVFAAHYDFYVDAEHTSDENGEDEKNSTFNNLTDAINAALSKKENERNIFVKKGKYVEKITLEKGVKITGAEKEKVIISGTITMKQDTLLKNLTVLGGLPAVLVENAEVVIENCVIKNFQNIGIQLLPGEGLVKVVGSSIFGGVGKGIYVQEGRKIEISNNGIYANTEEGLDLRARVEGVIKNNSIYENRESGIEFIVGGSKINISGNTIKRNGASGITSQFYAETKKTGRIFITGNNISGNKKYGLDCGMPSGGDPAKNYWINSLELSGNVIQQNGKSAIKNSCDIIQALDKEKEKIDNKISGQSAKNDNPSLNKKLLEAEMVKAKEEKEKEEAVWQEAGKIMTEQKELEKYFEINLTKLKQRSGLKTFFIGTDYNLVKTLKNDIKICSDSVNQLKNYLSQIKDEEKKEILSEQIRKKEETMEIAKVFVEKQEKKFSLFGWLIKIFG